MPRKIRDIPWKRLLAWLWLSDQSDWQAVQDIIH
jgi:hypothetical protein